MTISDSVKNTVIEAARKHRVSFENIIGGFEDRGILNSEMLAVCSLAEELGVEVFIESGRWKGQSTEILARYFANKPVRIESIELYCDTNATHVEEKMKGYHNLTLHYGDANHLLPTLVKKNQSKKIAILFDGPKGQEALDIFQYCLTQSENVVVGFFHDMRKSAPGMISRSREEMESMFSNAFYTDNSAFVEEFSILDQGCDTFLWSPYKIDGKKIGSYGPTIGLVFPDEGDIQVAHRNKITTSLKMLKKHTFYMGIKLYQIIRRVFAH